MTTTKVNTYLHTSQYIQQEKDRENESERERETEKWQAKNRREKFKEKVLLLPTNYTQCLHSKHYAAVVRSCSFIQCWLLYIRECARVSFTRLYVKRNICARGVFQCSFTNSFVVIVIASAYCFIGSVVSLVCKFVFYSALAFGFRFHLDRFVSDHQCRLRLFCMPY